ncbi:MAG: hypothetical protein NTV88_00945 [Candidatus Micrarchaeota archaeon]|nr:hypothetical protein [Candidatus Micrarchaeota archaeon]
MKLDPWAKIAKENNNRRYDVKGTVEIGDDGYLEVCLMAADGRGQILHLHRTTDGKNKEISWDCWVFEDNGKVRRHHSMKEKI